MPRARGSFLASRNEPKNIADAQTARIANTSMKASVAAANFDEMRLEVTAPRPATRFLSLSHATAANAVFVGSSDGRYQRWLRPLDTTQSRVFARTGRATAPFWFRDNQSVAFFAGAS